MMSMKKMILYATLLVCALSAAAVYNAWAQFDSIVGVKAGDNFTYSFVVYWRSTNPSVVVPQVFSDLNQTHSIHVNVTAAADTRADLTITRYMRDGTHTTEVGFIEVSAGRGTQNAQLLIIAANLTAGDKAYPLSDETAVAAGAAAASFTITETIAKTYLGIPMTVNHYSERITNTTTGDYVNRDAYYDQATGIMLEMTFEHYSASVDEVDTEQWKITQLNNAGATVPSDNGNNGTNGTTSNAGLPDWLTFVGIAVVVVVVAVLTAVFMLRRRKNTQPQAPPTAQVPASPQTPA
jgi:hypothetical protein